MSDFMSKDDEIFSLGKDVLFLIEVIIDERESISDGYQSLAIANLTQIGKTIGGLICECLPEIHEALIDELTTPAPSIKKRLK